MRSKLYRYLHPTLGLTYGPITVEIDGEYEALPVELKTVSTFDALECNQRKMRAMIMQRRTSNRQERRRRSTHHR